MSVGVLDLLHQYHYTNAVHHLLGRQPTHQIPTWDEHCHLIGFHDWTSRVWIPGGSLWSEEDVWTGADCHDCCFLGIRDCFHRSQWIHVTHCVAHFLEAGHGHRHRVSNSSGRFCRSLAQLCTPRWNAESNIPRADYPLSAVITAE